MSEEGENFMLDLIKLQFSYKLAGNAKKNAWVHLSHQSQFSVGSNSF